VYAPDGPALHGSVLLSATSSDGNYTGSSGLFQSNPFVNVTLYDDDATGVLVSSSVLAVGEGMSNGKDIDSVQVQLASQPLGVVEISMDVLAGQSTMAGRVLQVTQPASASGAFPI